MDSNAGQTRMIVNRLLSEYGMLIVLALLCAFFSWITFDEQHPRGAAAAAQVAEDILEAVSTSPSTTVMIVARDHAEDREFSTALAERLRNGGVNPVATINGQPRDARLVLEKMQEDGSRLDVIAANDVTAGWPVFRDLNQRFPDAAPATRIVQPRPFRWPNFLKADNLLNVANQIVVIAIIAIGMTMVIITGGIDLSVGSLIALSAVVAAWFIHEWGGATEAGVPAMIGGCLAAVLVCSVLGLFSGTMVTRFEIPPFIVTLGMMLVASGLAYIISDGQSIYELPESFIWLGRGADLFGIPNAVLLMAVLYGAAHLLMSRMSLGRYIYAVGGNAEAARLSGVPVKRILLFVYTICAGLAGLGGVVMASQLRSGTPTYGLMYELYVIAAVVVGGTSLSGGEGKILGTLIGAFIIAVIQNGMNLMSVESYTQKVVLGLVILGAVLIDRLKKKLQPG